MDDPEPEAEPRHPETLTADQVWQVPPPPRPDPPVPASIVPPGASSPDRRAGQRRVRRLPDPDEDDTSSGALPTAQHRDPGPAAPSARGLPPPWARASVIPRPPQVGPQPVV